MTAPYHDRPLCFIVVNRQTARMPLLYLRPSYAQSLTHQWIGALIEMIMTGLQL